jgi:hypothetical protein
MKTIILDEPIIQVIQEEITREITEFQILKYEDNGTQIKALTNLGYVITHDGTGYPEGGIFSLRPKDIDDVVVVEIENLR